MQTEQLLCWSSMTDTEHITSGSNEVVVSASVHVASRLGYFTFSKL